jgi:hypothetical protein
VMRTKGSFTGEHLARVLSETGRKREPATATV